MTAASSVLHRTATEIAADVRARRTSAVEITRSAIATIEAHNGSLGAFTDVTADRALREAEAVDDAVASGAAPPMAGVPFAAKNLFDIEGVVTRAGSKINRDNAPARADATLVKQMTDAGAILIGGLNMGEYAYDFTGENSHDGPSLNPHNPTRMSGGSSGGSGTAVAAGMVALALGSDTNGSIRVPSSFCGLFGLKPTFGRLSRAGTFPFCASLDHLGPMARSAHDLALSFDVLQARDPADPAQADRPFLATEPTLTAGSEGLRIAVADGYFREGGAPEANAAVDHIAAALGVTEMATVPETARARAAAYVITNSESSALHLDRLRTRAADFDPDTRDRFLAGAMLPAAWLVRAQRFRAWFHKQMLALFERVDAILAPATPFHALPGGTKTVELNGQTVPARPNIGIYTQPISFIGLPVVSVPVWLPNAALPIGVQVVAPPWREDIALRIAATLEENGAVSAPIAGL